MAPGAAQPLGEVGAEPNDDTLLYHFSVSQFVNCRSARISIKLADVPYTFLLDTGPELSVLPSCILSQLSPEFFGTVPRTRSVHGIADRDVEITGPYHLPVEVCGVKFMHTFYILESQTPCVAGYDLICDAKLVIDQVRQMVWSYWHVDLYATPPQPPTPSLLPMSESTPTTSVSTADRWLSDCFRLVGLDPPTTVESPSTDPSQRPYAAMSPSTHTQSPSTLLPSLSPCALSAFQDDPVQVQVSTQLNTFPSTLYYPTTSYESRIICLKLWHRPQFKSPEEAHTVISGYWYAL